MELPLAGIRAVEASAGTGKTFTIATLYLRLLLECGLKVDEIVVATFTRAAAAELSTRLRERLLIADAVLAGADPVTPRADDDGEHAASRQVIAHALAAHVEPTVLRQRARAARLALDTACIGTLHSFCHRALAEFGFETGQALAQPELVDDLHALETEIVRDAWRRGSADAATAQLLADTWGAPETLAQQVCDSRWRGREVHVAEPDLALLERDVDALRQAIAGWDDAALAQADSEISACFSHSSARRPRCAALRVLRDWASAQTIDMDAKALTEANRFDPAVNANLASFVRQPGGAVLDTVQRLRVALAAMLQARELAAGLPAARLLRDTRTYLEAELPRRLAARNLMGHDQAVDRLVAALADGERGQRAAARIRARWKAALVDEFQDTDPRQWRVVQTLFGPSTLVLVGDPKQAIYNFRGGDVFAWLAARAAAAGEPLRLAESWRAGAGLCHATNALFSQPDAFIEAGIEHPDIRAATATTQRALLRAGKILPALQLWWLDPEIIGHSARNPFPSKARAAAAIQRACVAWIGNVLHDDAIRLRAGDGQLQRLQPRHIAVLVNSNAEAHALQAALSQAGIPASCNLRASVYASDEAADLTLLLDALAAPDDLRRARAARASLLLGDDATHIARGIEDNARQATLLADIASWAGTVQRHGPLPWLHRLIATAASRLLATPGGQRRVANYLQLAELLQDLAATCFGVGDLATRFARARVEATDDADSARLRLDTDADAVTVATVHAAKGLEYSVVLVPYAALGRNPAGKQGARPALCWHHAGNAARVAIGSGASDAVHQRARDEIRAEAVRKLYVAVTRASALCVLPWGPVNLAQHSAAYDLLHVAGRAQALPLDAAGCAAALHELCTRAHGAATLVDELPVPDNTPDTTPVGAAGELHARDFTRAGLERDWQVWSFSRLVRGSPNQAAADPSPGAGDSDALDTRGPAGPRFGTAVHAVFEQTDFAAWRNAAGLPASERPLIEHSLRDQGLDAGTAALRHAVDLAGTCVRAALTSTLPCGVRLCDIAPAQRRAEIEFHLSLNPARTADLYALLHRYGYQQQRHGVAAHTLHGLLTGKIDLTFNHVGQFHLIDWKTNRCAAYDDATLRAEIAVHDYDLQWLVYTLALHRWLRQQLADYDYARDVGDVYYLFVRGMADGHGVHADRPARELIVALDALFGHDEGRDA
jgi:exodeoxyribonuclease V beta subunit